MLKIPNYSFLFDIKVEMHCSSVLSDTSNLSNAASKWISSLLWVFSPFFFYTTWIFCLSLSRQTFTRVARVDLHAHPFSEHLYFLAVFPLKKLPIYWAKAIKKMGFFLPLEKLLLVRAVWCVLALYRREPRFSKVVLCYEVHLTENILHA